MAVKKTHTIVTAHEEAQVLAQRSVSGRVTIQTKVETTDETVTAFLENDLVDVVRIVKNQPLDKATYPTTRVEGDVTIIPVIEEVLVVEKRLVLKEEIHITRRTETKKVEVPITLKRQSSVIRRQGADGKTASEE